jgi:RNA polymerase sigma-70 factor, ECF subfamily
VQQVEYCQPVEYCNDNGIEKLEVANLDEGTLPDAAPSVEAPQSAQWTELVQRIRSGDPTGMQDLYQVFGRGVRIYLCRQLGMQDLDDKVHDTFLIVVQAIQNGDLREPDRLMGFVRTIARRLVAGHIDQMVHRRRDDVAVESGIVISDKGVTPEQKVIDRQKIDLMLEVLKELSDRDRDILTRFYLYEQSQELICSEMKLTATQFRLLKSRAKNRFAELGKKKLEKKNSLRGLSLFMY